MTNKLKVRLLVLLIFFLPFVCRAETIDILPKCVNLVCQSSLDDIVVSNDGSFFLIADIEDKNIRRVDIVSGEIVGDTIIPLNSLDIDVSVLKIGISLDNKKAFVLGISTGDDSSLAGRKETKLSHQATDCRCASGQYFDGTTCISGTLDCSNTETDTVCSCDNLNFLNSCIAMANGVKKFTKGTCGSGGSFSCSTDSQCPIGTCPNGNTFTRFTCTSSGSPKCNLVTFSTDPCTTATSTDCRCPSGQYFNGEDCISGALDCLNILSDQVCSCDNLNFLNSCIAMANGVKKFTKGSCGSGGNLACASDDQCPISECSNGVSFEKFSCKNGKCTHNEFSVDPCTSLSAVNPGAKNVHIIDFTNNTVSTITPTFVGDTSSSDSELALTTVSFFDPSGSKLIASNNDSGSPRLFIIDSMTGEIEKEIEVEAIAESIEFDPLFERAVITFTDESAQSIGVFSSATRRLTKFDLPASIFFKIDEFLSMVDFDLAGNKAVVSSLGGLHVFHLLNLKDVKLTIKILDRESQGQTISTISPDGNTSISVANDEELDGVVVYKLDSTNIKRPRVIKKITFPDGSRVLDATITPDNNRVHVLVKNGTEKKLKILKMDDLSTICEISVSEDTDDSFLVEDSLGRYVLIPDFKETAVNIVKDLKLGPIFKSITPSKLQKGKNVDFIINGFIDQTTFTDDLQVCFGNKRSCASSVTISNNGTAISGTTPKLNSLQSSNLILIAEEKPVVDNASSSQCEEATEVKSFYKNVLKLD